MFERRRQKDPNGYKLRLRNEDEKAAAEARIDDLMDADSGTDAGDELEWLVNQVQMFERQHDDDNSGFSVRHGI